MSLLKKIQDKYGVIHEIGDNRVDSFETELTGAEHNVPYSPAVLKKTNAIEQKIDDHTKNLSNPHEVTKEQIGLANVENKSSTQIRSEITKKNVTDALGYTPIDESKIGAVNGVASLDASGKIPASQIPGGFDEIEEYDTITAFPATGAEGKIYVTKDTNLTYRWTGSQYIEISASLALGETSKTAYRGDRGKIAYEHSQITGNTSIHHTHSNKALLDSYKQTEANLANAVAKVHEHENKTVLDGITSDKVASWDSKAAAFDILPTTKGGTGTNASSQEKLTNTLINTLTVDSNTPSGDDYYVGQAAGGGTTNTTYKRRTLSSLWNYIKGQISSVLGLTASNYSGKAATAGTADKAVADNSGNNIVNTYATKTELNAKQNKLKAGDNITIDGNTISSNQIFVATYGTTKYAEVKAAYDAGKLCTVFKDKRYYYIKLIDTTSIMFTSSFATSTDNTIYSLTLSSSDSWTTYNGSLQSKLSFDTVPKAGSKNPVTSNGIKTAIDTIDAKGLTVKEISGEQVICFE